MITTGANLWQTVALHFYENRKVLSAFEVAKLVQIHIR
jgi:hypothetical protein